MATPQDILQAAYELADRYPDNVYEPSEPSDPSDAKCSYLTGSNTEAPAEGCLIGQAILTVMPEAKPVLHKRSTDAVGLVMRELFGPMYDNRDTAEVALQLGVLQHRQDMTFTWGHAAADARRAAQQGYDDDEA